METRKVNYLIQLVLIFFVLLTGLYYLIRPVLDVYLIQTESNITKNYIENNSAVLKDTFNSISYKDKNGCHQGTSDPNCRTIIPDSLKAYTILGLHLSDPNESAEYGMISTLASDGVWGRSSTANPEFIPQNARLLPLFKGKAKDSLLWGDHFPPRQDWYVVTPFQADTDIYLMAKKISCSNTLCSFILYLRKTLR